MPFHCNLARSNEMEPTELLGYFVADDENLANSVDQAAAWISAEHAQRNADILNAAWNLKPNEKFVVTASGDDAGTVNF